ncbi:pro-resilin-like isoform X2 [Macrobrachium nipponense]|uniref:pro-resilin-like isoform X2 n=1 Tax=Macrobrachium nipponense TaxID=159736 RepID=UPI0030C8917C
MPKDNMPLKLNDTERSILKTERCWKILIFLGLVAAAVAVSRLGDVVEGSSKTHRDYGDPKYSFSWEVSDESSENDFGHEESREGDDTEGSYYVRLPDGRFQTVKYYVSGDSGYVAEVTYESGESSEEFGRD